VDGFVALDKGDFLGRDVLDRARQKPLARPRGCFPVDDPVQLHGGETILLDDQPLGMVTSGSYGYTLGKTIAYGYLPRKSIKPHHFEIEFDCERFVAHLQDEARL
jgi:glycine cleavage system aminomethyltransferase T